MQRVQRLWVPAVVAMLLCAGAATVSADEGGEDAPRLQRRALDREPADPNFALLDRDAYVRTGGPAASPGPDAGGGRGGAYGLATQLQNPVADLISVPIQANLDQGFGPGDHAYRWTINVQPVIPIHLNRRWNVISRTILPVVVREGVLPAEDDVVGLGDTVQSFFFSPRDVRGFIWGAGPAFLLPTATDAKLGRRQWAAGPTGVILRQSGPWTYGMLANHLWSFADAGDRDEVPGDSDVNATFLQPFVTYTFPSAFTLGVSTESTYDWEREAWAVPINLFASQVTMVCRQPISLGLGVRYWAESPTGGPEWGIRLNVTLLFPKR